MRWGLGSKSRRNLDYPRGWRGLSWQEAGLLVAHISRADPPVDELYTDVVVGAVPADEYRGVTQEHHDLWASTHGLRIDAVARMGGQWWILECKADAGYCALGQLLTYVYWGGLADPRLATARLGVVTDVCQITGRPVFAQHGVEVFEYADVLRG